MVIPFSLIFLLPPFESAIACMQSELTPTCELAMETMCLRMQPSVAEVMGTKWNLHVYEVQHESNAMPEKEPIRYAKDRDMDGLGLFRALWAVVDLMLGQFILKPVSGQSVSWSPTIPGGIVSSSSIICTSFLSFGQSLVGFETTGLVVGAGSTFVECMDPTVARQMTDHFSLLSSASTTASERYLCHGNSWNIGPCNGPSISVSVDAQSNVCNCDSTETLVIRPCHGNANWGGIGANICNTVTTILSIEVFTGTTNIPTNPPTVQPTNSSMIQSREDVDMTTDFHTVDRDGDAYLNYYEIAFAITDTNKDGKLSIEEYEAARRERILVDTSYTLTNSSIADDADLITDFGIIDKNEDGYLNYDEVAYAIADTSKDGKLSYNEYEAARADGIFVDTSYTLE